MTLSGATHNQRVSVLIPARNEQENIAACIESLLAQDSVQGDSIEIIVADDSSEDGTARIVESIAARHSHVLLIRVPPLPAEWLGKNHALHIAVQHARGEWLLFTDSDTRHAPGKISTIIERAEREGLHQLSFSPEQITETWWEKAVIPIIYDQLAQLYSFDRVNDPADAHAAANGQYILIRRATYDAVGGHEAIRGELLEDVALAKRVKQAGYRIWFGSGRGVVSTRMYLRFGDMWEGWTKNLFLLLGRDTRALCAAALRLVARPRWSVYYPPGAAIVFLLLINSYWRYSRNLGVSWKGRRYSSGGR
ncbi:MAG: glycosyltransferase [Acidobacteria bacterium]|nr:glycosyltransferase [Acidobacteriota bacterium]